MAHFCYHCGEVLTVEVLGEDRPRECCKKCGYIHYENPKVHVTVAASSDNRLLWVRRNIEPRRGYWELPGGFMELGETLREAAVRELYEETGIHADVRSLQLCLVATLDFMGEVHILFRAEVEEQQPVLCEETMEAGWFNEKEAPWCDLAFPQTEKGLRLFYQDLQQATQGIYYAEQSLSVVFLEKLSEKNRHL